jgi:hypothetical protein
MYEGNLRAAIEQAGWANPLCDRDGQPTVGEYAHRARLTKTSGRSCVRRPIWCGSIARCVYCWFSKAGRIENAPAAEGSGRSDSGEDER